MSTAYAEPNPAAQPPPQRPYEDPSGLGPRKTIFVLCTVAGCIAILWPKIFHPMMFGADDASPTNNLPNINNIHNLRPGGLRQERPPHLRASHIHPAMIERGRAIPSTQSVPIVAEKRQRAVSPPQYVDGRPGPLPGMRPPMGAGSVRQPQQKANGMGIVMPLYTLAIVAFFAYTIIKLVLKRDREIYPPVKENEPKFKEEVFNRPGHKIANLDWKEHDTNQNENDSYIFDRHFLPKSTLEYHLRDAEQLLDISILKQKIRKTERTMDQIIEEIKVTKQMVPKTNGDNTNDFDRNASDVTQDATNGNEPHKTNGHIKSNDSKVELNGNMRQHRKLEKPSKQKEARDSSADRTLKVLGLEMRASCENGGKWTRPSSPTLDSSSTQIRHSTSGSESDPEPQSIYLEGALPHESQILVAESQTTSEGVYEDDDVDDNVDEPAVILSSKMTLSLINLDPVTSNNGVKSSKESLDSVSDDDIEELQALPK